MYGIKSEFSDSSICRGCLSTDRKLSPLTNYDLFFSLLKKHPSEDVKYYNILLCWECDARLRSTAVFQRRLQDTQYVLSLAYDKITHVPLSPLKYTHKTDYDYSIEETIDIKPDITAIDNCKVLLIKEEINIDGIDDDINDGILNYSDEIKEERKYIKKRKKKRPNNERSFMKKIDNGIDFKKLELYFSKVSLSETEVEESLAMERSDNDSIRRPLKCSVCGFRFSKKKMLYLHKKQNHKKRTIPAKCEHCDSSYSTRADLLMHWRRLHPVNRCSFCHLIVEKDEDRDKHLREHLFRYHCLNCGVDFLDRLTFQHHEDELHTKYECANCAFKTPSRKTLEKHMRNHHLPNPCPNCDRVFPNRARLMTHLEKHENAKERSYCVECDKVFSSRVSYSRHLNWTKTHKNTLKPYDSVSCPDCGKIFARKSYMKNHFNLYHSNTSKHHCTLCDKYFANGFGLRKHSAHVHEKQPVPKTKMCSVCGRAFSTNRILENHMRTHTGERPFACHRCSAAFAQRVALQSHLRCVHKER